MSKTAAAMNTGPSHGSQSAITTRNQVMIVFGAGLGLATGFGPFFFSVSGVFLKPLAAAFQWGRADVAVLPMLAMLGTALAAPIMGMIADRLGWRRVIGTSIVIFALALLLLSMVPANHLLFMAVGLLIGVAGAATSAAGYIAILPGAFDKRLGMAFGFAMLGTGIGGFVMPIVAQKMIAAMDWRTAYMVIAGAALVLGLISHQLIFRNFKGMDSVPSSSRASRLELQDEGVNLSFREAICSSRFWLLAIVFFFVSCAVLGAFIHLAPFVSDRGLGREVAAQAAAVVGVGLAVARVGIGVVLDRVFAPVVAAVAFLFGAIVFACMVSDLIRLPGMVMLSALVLGLATGSEGDLIPYLTRRYFGTRSLGSIYGALFGASTLGGAVGPFVYGMVFDHMKSYAPAHEVSAVLCLVCAVVILLIGPYPGHVSKAKGERSVLLH